MSMLRASLLMMTLMVRASRTSAAEHMCTKMENYTVTSMETYVEPVVVNTFTWCLRIPPRCPETRTEMRQRYRTKLQVKSRTVEECCEGYISMYVEGMSKDENERKEEKRCVPLCVNCLAGVCVSPNKCHCHSGYIGEDCSKECSPGLWGIQCMQECDCGMNVTCEATNGTCHCPPGRRGPRCADTCPSGFWGPGCSNKCRCEDIFKSCHPENGNCVFSIRNSSVATNTSSVTLTITTVASEITQSEKDVTHFPTIIRQIASEFDNHVVPSAVDRSFEVTKEKSAAAPPSTRENLRAKAPSGDNESSTTVRPMIVLVSVPDRRHILAKDRAKFALQDTLLGRFEEKKDFVKKIEKEEDAAAAGTTVPLNIALIVVASVVFLGLTSIAVFAILHMRSKLLESVRLSIYDNEKAHSHHIKEKSFQRQAPRIPSNLINNAFPQTPIQANALFLQSIGRASNASETTVNMETVDGYANGAIATTGLRIFRDFHDFIQGDHYDRPPTTLLRLRGNFEEERCTEHLYDEIPLQSSPLSNRKSTP